MGLNTNIIRRLSLLAMCLLYACNFNSVFINNPEDVHSGESYLTAFYGKIALGGSKAIDTMSSDTLKNVLGPTGLSKIAYAVKDKIGNYEKYTVLEYFTKRIKTDTGINIFFKYKLRVIYDKGEVVEVVGLEKQDNSAIRVISYNVYF